MKKDQVIATKKGIRFSDYKLIYKNLIWYASKKQVNEKFTGSWHQQSTDGGEPNDTYNSLKELKWDMKNYAK